MKKILTSLALMLVCATASAGYPWVYMQQLTAADLNAAFLARTTYTLGALTQYGVLLGNSNGDVRVIASLGTSGQILKSAGPGAPPAFASNTLAAITAAYNTQTSSTYTVTATDSTLVGNYAGTITYTLPAAASYTGRMLTLRTVTANTVVSASANVVPLAGGSAGTAILAGTAGKWADLQSDGTAWQIVRSN